MPKIRIALISLLVFAALMSGCSSNRPASSSAPEQQRFDLSNPRFSNPQWVKEILYAQYGEWRAVKYQNGGLSKKGIDCSGLVYLTFDSRFSIKLPRSTNEQINAGPEIPQSKLVPGDLVFFKTGTAGKTGKWQQHVGIYIEDRKFLHASTEKGVMISSLDDQYWSRAYWKSVRIKPGNGALSLR